MNLKMLISAQTPGERCKLLRNSKNITQEQLAEMADCSVELISAIERGKRELTPKKAAIFSSIFDVKKEFLLCQDDMPTDLMSRLRPIVIHLVKNRKHKEAFSLYLESFGLRAALKNDNIPEKYSNMSTDEFCNLDTQEVSSAVEKFFSNDLAYYALQDESGQILTRCSVDEYDALAQEISDFVEFKIEKLLERDADNG